MIARSIACPTCWSASSEVWAVVTRWPCSIRTLEKTSFVWESPETMMICLLNGVGRRVENELVGALELPRRLRVYEITRPYVFVIYGERSDLHFIHRFFINNVVFLAYFGWRPHSPNTCKDASYNRMNHCRNSTWDGSKGP